MDTTQADQTTQINNAAAQAHLPPAGAEMPGSQFVARDASYVRVYSAVASSLDGKTTLAAVSGGKLYVSSNYGVTWEGRDSNRSWSDVSCSADGALMAAAVFNGPIYLSSNSGATWASTSSGDQAWVGLAGSANGTILAAVAQNGSLYISTNRGAS